MYLVCNAILAALNKFSISIAVVIKPDHIVLVLVVSTLAVLVLVAVLVRVVVALVVVVVVVLLGPLSQKQGSVPSVPL